MTNSQTLFEKIWNAHVVSRAPDVPEIIYVDLHLVHEVTSPQAFESLRKRGLNVRRPERTVATMDHSTPTSNLSLPLLDDMADRQIRRLQENCREFGIQLYSYLFPPIFTIV